MLQFFFFWWDASAFSIISPSDTGIGWKFKISKILKFRNSNFKTCRMPTEMNNFKLKTNQRSYFNMHNSGFWGWLSIESQPQNPEFRINPETFHPCTGQGDLSHLEYDSTSLCSTVKAFIWHKVGFRMKSSYGKIHTEFLRECINELMVRLSW